MTFLRNDVFGDCNLFHGDCLDVMPTLQRGSVDMVLCDLPYGTTRCAWDSVIDLDRLWSEYRRVCKPDAAIVLFAQTPFDKVLGASNLEQLRYEWIWEKTAATGHLNAAKMPMKAHENVLVFYDRLPVYNPIKTEGHIIKRVKRGGPSSAVYDRVDREHSYESDTRFPRSVITLPKDKQRVALHPTQKPVSICEYLIQTYSHAGMTVLDNTMGSGTTGIAARINGRRFIGIEKDPTFYAVACSRIAGHFL